jgi:ElaB/YqjD/DUF883 family membrane-anchored ribosome-binding protein
MDNQRTDSLNGDARSQEIRQQIKDTRSALTDKMESLKDRVTGQVETTRNSVDDTIHSIKRTFDLKHQVDQHPWPMMGGAIFAGVVLGHMSRTRRWPTTKPQHNGHVQSENQFEPAQANGIASTVQASQEPSGENHWLQTRVQDELSRLQSEAIAAGLGVFRDWMERTLSNSEHGIADRS